MRVGIKSWSKQKKVFYGLGAAAIITGGIYAGLKIRDYVVSHRIDKKKNQQKK